MRLSLLAVGVAALALPALADDLGEPVHFRGKSPAGVHPLQSGVHAFDSGVSDPIAAPFDTVLFHGVATGALDFEAARRSGSGTWSRWEKAHFSAHPQGRFWAKARFPSAAPGSLRVRAKAAAGSAGRSLLIFSMSAFDSGEGEDPDAGTPAPPAPDGARKPEVHGRETWGAKPARQTPVPHTPERITQHHTEGKQPTSLADSLNELRFIQDFHQNGRGWSDIAYHFLIDAEGRIFQGRPERVQGSHTRGHNAGNVGVVLLGSHHPPLNHAVTPAELRALQALGRWLVDAYAIPPKTYAGHRDLVSTSCPGDILHPLLGRIRDSWSQPPLPVPDLANGRESAARARDAAARPPGLFDGRLGAR